ncbi:GvpL/GvpF family gas vesicle protein [Streptosporangium carneum]|uniref:Gas vesicle protein GvpFL n=1 Tax=Streptosporangium carneum TaxID=47481 RepID=A0A9W6HVF5_9ACTN|nr:GvpL/GvpF family gas vesicle protein [Streptosporangium carneum]GLK07022.1 hypothetical protein GCM10017600_04270 [Streptosporangium carneum]
MTEAGTYVYAITRDAGTPRPEGLRGVAGAPVRTVERAGLVAYVSTVPLDQFGEEPLRRSLEDLDWVGSTARAHHHVVETVAQAVATAPVRLVTVYSGEEQVGDLLERRHDDFVEVLSRVAGRREWGVKAYVGQVAESPLAGGRTGGDPGGRTGETGGPGTAYLKRRQSSLRDRENVWRHAAAQAEHVHASLAAAAVASRRHRPQDPELSGRTEWMVLNGAYLVDDDRSEEFVAALDALRGHGLDLELTGPWAPYSFTAVDLGAADRETADSPGVAGRRRSADPGGTGRGTSADPGGTGRGTSADPGRTRDASDDPGGAGREASGGPGGADSRAHGGPGTARRGTPDDA